MHDQSRSCDLESVYQILSVDVLPNTNFLLFQTDSDDFDAAGYQHPVAGLAQQADIRISFYHTEVISSIKPNQSIESWLASIWLKNI